MTEPLLVTLTANPSIDRTVMLTGPLERGEVIRASEVLSQSAGKGVNISRAAVAAGVPTLAVLPAEADDPFVADLRRDGIECSPQGRTGAIRVNLTLTEPDGTTTKVNAPGAALTRTNLDDLASAVLKTAEEATWVALAGSLPPGAPEGWYAELCRALVTTPAKVAVDTSEAPLLALAEQAATARPDLIKPNADELEQLTGHDARSIETNPAEAMAAGRELIERGIGAVLATLGAHGAVLVTAEGAWHATPPPITLVSTVGAGDSSLFGYLAADLDGASPADRLRRAVAYGSAAASLPGTTIPRPDQTHPELAVIAELFGANR